MSGNIEKFVKSVLKGSIERSMGAPAIPSHVRPQDLPFVSMRLDPRPYRPGEVERDVVLEDSRTGKVILDREDSNESRPANQHPG